MKQIRAQIEETTSDYDKEKLQERLAKLVGGVAVINVGAATETEMKEKKARVEDALHATRAAVEEGIVAGGGVAYIRAASCLDTPEAGARPAGGRGHRPEGAVRAGRSRSRSTPARTAASSSTRSRAGRGTTATTRRTEEFEDLMKAGILDPTKVTRVALQNAASVAGLMITTECAIAEKPEEKKDMPQMPPGGGGMY